MSITVGKVDGLLGHKVINYKIDEESMMLEREDGLIIMFYHMQDCCECVTIDDVDGNLNDLLGTYIEAEEVTREGGNDDLCESELWTFYKFGTDKGYVSIRWLGISNGYYSESVDIRYYIPEQHVITSDYKVIQYLDGKPAIHDDNCDDDLLNMTAPDEKGTRWPIL